MRYLLDTSGCVHAWRAREPTLRRLAEVGPDAVALSATSVANLRYGALKSRAPEATSAQLDQFFAVPEVLAFDADAAECHAEGRRALEAAGTPIGERDLVIAATALAYGLVVATAKAREFRWVAGLGVAARVMRAVMPPESTATRI